MTDEELRDEIRRRYGKRYLLDLILGYLGIGLGAWLAAVLIWHLLRG